MSDSKAIAGTTASPPPALLGGGGAAAAAPPLLLLLLLLLPLLLEDEAALAHEPPPLEAGAALAHDEPALAPPPPDTVAVSRARLGAGYDEDASRLDWAPARAALEPPPPPRCGGHCAAPTPCVCGVWPRVIARIHGPCSATLAGPIPFTLCSSRGVWGARATMSAMMALLELGGGQEAGRAAASLTHLKMQKAGTALILAARVRPSFSRASMVLVPCPALQT